jgi:hypothetical protein
MTLDLYKDGVLDSWIRDGQLNDPNFKGPGPQPLERAVSLDLARTNCEAGKVTLEEDAPSVIGRWIDGSDALDFRWTLIPIDGIPERD